MAPHYSTSMKYSLLFLYLFMQLALCLVPPKFQWKTIDFAWDTNHLRDTAIQRKEFIPENNMPTGIERWKNKLFLTIPRLKAGVPSSLNYVYVNGSANQPLNPYPSWSDAFVHSCNPPRNRSVVCAFRAHVDSWDRLWVVDNGVTDITDKAKQVSEPAIMVFELNTDQLVHKFVLGDNVVRDSSVLTSIVVDVPNKGKDCKCPDTFAYITDMGSNAIIVYDMANKEAWRVEHPFFHFDPHAGKYRVGGIEFYWSDGISSAALSKPNKDGYRDLYFHPTSSTKQFKMSTKLLRDKNAPNDELFSGVQILGDKGEMTQTTACDFDPQNNVLFYTQLSKNGLGCWNIDKPFTEENLPLIFSDCNLMEFPSDVKVDSENNVWILSNRQARFLYGSTDPRQVNYRVLSAPAGDMVKGTSCEKQSALCRAFGCMKRSKSGSRSSSASK